jgi:glycylpeptide N-tetradecanoyltransferase
LRQIDNLAPLYDAHDFWDSQPVPKAYEKIEDSMLDRPIDSEKTLEDVRQEAYPLPAGFTWCNVNIGNRAEAQEVYDLLT